MFKKKRLWILIALPIIVIIGIVLYYSHRNIYINEDVTAMSLCGEEITITKNLIIIRTFPFRVRIHGSLIIDGNKYISHWDIRSAAIPRPNNPRINAITSFYSYCINIEDLNELWNAWQNGKKVLFSYDSIEFNAFMIGINRRERMFYGPAKTIDDIDVIMEYLL